MKKSWGSVLPLSKSIVRELVNESPWLLPLAMAFFLFPLNRLRPMENVTWGDVVMLLAVGCALFRFNSRAWFIGLPSQFFLPAGIFSLAAFLAFVDFQNFEDLVYCIQLITALMLIPATVAFTGQGYRHTNIVLSWAWILGNLFSSLVGIASHHGHSFLGFTDPAASNQWAHYRISGLAFHPNMYAMFVTMCVPVVLTRFIVTRNQAEKLLTLIVLPTLLYGIKLSGSRAALAALLMTACIFGSMFIYFSRNPKRALTQFAIAAVAIIGMYLAFDTGKTVDATQRLFGGEATDFSDAQRSEIHAKAKQDFIGSPIYGVGYRNIRFAHNIYLQVLQSSGIIGFSGFMLFLFIVFRMAQLGLRRVIKDRATLWKYLSLICAILTWLIAGSNQNAIIERGVCIPIALLLLLYVDTIRAGFSTVALGSEPVMQRRIQPDQRGAA